MSLQKQSVTTQRTRRSTTQSNPMVLRNIRLGQRGALTNLRLENGVIAEIGYMAAAGAHGIEVVDARGRTVVPGLWDAHVHMVQWACARRRVDVSSATSAHEAATLIADALRIPSPSGEVTVGYGFRDSLWVERPDKSILEAAAPGQPIFVLSNDLHVAWLSPAALALIGRGDHHSGVFLETEAHEVQAALPGASAEEVDRWVAEASTIAASRGVTGLLDFEIANNVADWTRRFRHHDLDLRVSCAIYPPYLEDAITQQLRSGEAIAGSDNMLSTGPVKIFIDGSLNTRTALCGEPYPGMESLAAARGLLLTEADELDRIMKHASSHGLLPAVHAIGDEANTIALDAFERVGCGGRIEHAQLLREKDVPRFGRLGIIAGVQPAHIPGDRDVADRLWSGRTGRSFRYADLLAAGAQLEIGSDAPVTPLDPWGGIASAISRTDDSREPWHPEQIIGIDDAIAAASRGRRHLSVGDVADLTIVDADPTDLSVDELRSIPVFGTLLGGRWTYRS